MERNSLRQSTFAVLAALIWGTAFVAQSVGAEHVPALAFNASRSVIAFVFLLILCTARRTVPVRSVQPARRRLHRNSKTARQTGKGHIPRRKTPA